MLHIVFYPSGYFFSFAPMDSDLQLLLRDAEGLERSLECIASPSRPTATQAKKYLAEDGDLQSDVRRVFETKSRTQPESHTTSQAKIDSIFLCDSPGSQAGGSKL